MKGNSLDRQRYNCLKGEVTQRGRDRANRTPLFSWPTPQMTMLSQDPGISPVPPT